MATQTHWISEVPTSAVNCLCAFPVDAGSLSVLSHTYMEVNNFLGY